MAKINNNSNNPNGFKPIRASDVQKFVDYGNPQNNKPYSSYTRKNYNLLALKVNNIQSFLLFCLCCSFIKKGKTYKDSLTYDFSYSNFRPFIPNRTLYYECLKELKELKVIIKCDNNRRNSLYYLNPNFYNVMNNEQRKLCAIEMSDFFIP